MNQLFSPHLTRVSQPARPMQDDSSQKTQRFVVFGQSARIAFVTFLVALFIALGVFFGPAQVASAHSVTVSAHTIQSQSLHPLAVKCPTTANTQNQSIYQSFETIGFGTILFRVGWQPTSGSGGYGYCHVKAGHPDALNKITYILENGRETASSPTSKTIVARYPTGQQYQIYIVTSSSGMKDGRMRGIVSAYPIAG